MFSRGVVLRRASPSPRKGALKEYKGVEYEVATKLQVKLARQRKTKLNDKNDLWKGWDRLDTKKYHLEYISLPGHPKEALFKPSVLRDMTPLRAFFTVCPVYVFSDIMQRSLLKNPEAFQYGNGSMMQVLHFSPPNSFSDL
jgi:hypothetical protein